MPARPIKVLLKKKKERDGSKSKTISHIDLGALLTWITFLQVDKTYFSNALVPHVVEKAEVDHSFSLRLVLPELF